MFVENLPSPFSLVLSACLLAEPSPLSESTSPILTWGREYRAEPEVAACRYVAWSCRAEWVCFLSAAASLPRGERPIQVVLSWLLQLAEPVSMGTRVRGRGARLPSCCRCYRVCPSMGRSPRYAAPFPSPPPSTNPEMRFGAQPWFLGGISGFL